MWGDIPDIRRVLRVRAYMRRFLGSWNYNNLLFLLCATGPGTKLCWIEAVVDSGVRAGVCILRRVRYRRDMLVSDMHPTLSLVYAQHRLGKWVIDGDLSDILYKTMFLV